MRRWQISWGHIEIGLPQVFTNAALSRLRTSLVRIVQDSVHLDPKLLSPAIASLNKLLDLALAIIEDAYQAEFLKRQERTERLAAIGALAGGAAHELRNPLGIITNGVYFLRSAHPEASDDGRDAYDEISRGLATCNRLAHSKSARKNARIPSSNAELASRRRLLSFDASRAVQPDMFVRYAIQLLLPCGSAFFSSSNAAHFWHGRCRLSNSTTRTDGEAQP